MIEFFWQLALTIAGAGVVVILRAIWTHWGNVDWVILFSDPTNWNRMVSFGALFALLQFILLTEGPDYLEFLAQMGFWTKSGASSVLGGAIMLAFFAGKRLWGDK